MYDGIWRHCRQTSSYISFQAIEEAYTLDLWAILACPNCKVHVTRHNQMLICSECRQQYPIVDGIPVLLPDGSIPSTEYQQQLDVRPNYDPWLHRVVLQSLPASAIILDMGAGNLTLSLPNVIRMDVTLTPYVDVVGDAHALPFLPGTCDFIFSLAVIEHLRQPFIAAQQMYAALRPGGYVYGECNFVFAYHGYPHHYFNASQQGIEQIFAAFAKLRSGVAPYQMPSFAIRMLLQTYLTQLPENADELDWPEPAEFKAYRDLMLNLLAQPLGSYDMLFDEAAALRVAAGVYFFGYKAGAGESEVLPAVVQEVWRQDTALRQRFPDMFDIGHAENLLRWAQHEGRTTSPAIDEYFAAQEAFDKHGDGKRPVASAFQELPVIEPVFGCIRDEARTPLISRKLAQAEERIRYLEQHLREKDQHISVLEALIQRIESGRVMRALNVVQKLIRR
jgi:uncharacterized protein YbaR (Trm112 family)/SAM-dependent methyltransferase